MIRDGDRVRRDHGGDLDQAMRRFGGEAADWVDLSTGINPHPYPLPEIPARAWAALPTKAEIAGLTDAAAKAYRATGAILALAGAQAAIQLAPRLRQRGEARVIAPTYNEHRASLEAQGWRVAEGERLADLAGAGIAVVVNPNNPDGRTFAPADLLALSQEVGLLVVDESFADPLPDLSLAPMIDKAGGRVLVLRSFGKFYGLAGLRLGFAIGAAADSAVMEEMAGPWAVSGPAIAIGKAALNDRAWRDETIARLRKDAARLDALAFGAGWRLVGGADLFRLYETPNAAAAQERLGRAKVWSRAFPYSKTWLRLGLPYGDEEWAQVAAAFRAVA